MYKLPDENLWKGRVDSDASSLRYHQIVYCKQIDKLSSSHNRKSFGLIGFECDEGVRRNQGRIGAAFAPNEIKKALASLPYHHTKDRVFDVGNIVCVDNDLESAQKKLGDNIHKILTHHYKPIIIGGGHETLYGHYLGVRKYIGKEVKLGIINIDAHFDMRDDEFASSGTMFKQILDQDENTNYLCLGIQKLGNTKLLFDNAHKHDITYMFEEEVSQYDLSFDVINTFFKKCDYVILTLCTDSITSTAAPGVSAPSPFGLELKTVRKLIRHIISNDNLLSFDISEVNPLVDENNKTTQLAALLISDVMQNFH